MRVNVTRVRSPASLWNTALLAHKCCYQLQLSERTQSPSQSTAQKLGDLALHSIDAATTQNYGTGLNAVSSVRKPPIIESCFTFTPEQKANCGNQPRIADLVANKTARGQFFYGLEITSRHMGKTTCVDFNDFLPVLPTFISIAWLPHYFSVPMDKVETIQVVRHLEPYIPAMPHLSLYRQSKERFDEFFALNLTNLLAVHGDDKDGRQAYQCCPQLIEHARRVRGDSISISVAGHPEGYLLPNSEPDIDQNIIDLKQKINSGAEFIITQLCYTPELVLEYIQKARDAGIKAPIMVGVIVAENFKAYELMKKVTRVRLPPEVLAQVEQYKADDAKVRNFFVQLALRTIQSVLDADLGVHGVQFYTLNSFRPVQEVLCELRKMGILKESPPDDTDTCGDA